MWQQRNSNCTLRNDLLKENTRTWGKKLGVRGSLLDVAWFPCRAASAPVHRKHGKPTDVDRGAERGGLAFPGKDPQCLLFFLSLYLLQSLNLPYGWETNNQRRTNTMISIILVGGKVGWYEMLVFHYIIFPLIPLPHPKKFVLSNTCLLSCIQYGLGIFSTLKNGLQMVRESWEASNYYEFTLH